MKILLVAVNAKYIHSNPAIYSLKNCAGKYGDTVEIAEFTINHYPDQILREIYNRQADVVAFSCYIWNLSMIETVMENLVRVSPQTRLWLGGPEVSYDTREFLERHPHVEGIMIGEGEKTFQEMVDYWNGEGSLEEVTGIAYRQGQVIHETAQRMPLDMNELPFLYKDLKDFENRIIYYESSRGCPFSCSYCLSSIDKRVRFRNTETVLKELQFFLDRKVPQVKFVDRTFNCNHRHAQAIWTYIRDHDNGITNFHFEIAADLLNEEELQLLQTLRPGLIQLEIGVQSTNPNTIREIDRVMDFEELSVIVNRIRSYQNIHQHLDLIAGLPMEDYESFVHSFNDVYALHPDQLQLGFLKVLKGSKMHVKAQEYGIIYHSQPVYEVFYTRWLSFAEVLSLKEVEDMVEVYYNSGQFSETIRRLEAEFDTPFAMYRALADYYKEQGLEHMNHSRMRRFEILRDFIRTKTENPVYDEYLLIDLYLRENSKSRPKWACDPSVYKKDLLAFFKMEEEERSVLTGYEEYSAKQMMNMVHAEQVSGEIFGKAGRRWVIFDYRNRNILDQNATMIDITEKMGKLLNALEK